MQEGASGSIAGAGETPEDLRPALAAPASQSLRAEATACITDGLNTKAAAAPSAAPALAAAQASPAAESGSDSAGLRPARSIGAIGMQGSGGTTPEAAAVDGHPTAGMAALPAVVQGDLRGRPAAAPSSGALSEEDGLAEEDLAAALELHGSDMEALGAESDAEEVAVVHVPAERGPEAAAMTTGSAPVARVADGTLDGFLPDDDAAGARAPEAVAFFSWRRCGPTGVC